MLRFYDMHKQKLVIQKEFLKRLKEAKEAQSLL